MPTQAMSTPHSSVMLGEKTLAVLFTDVIDSTKVLDRGDSTFATDLWSRHDQNSRALMRLWSGQEVGRTDGFLVLFQSCADAVGFADAYHAMLAELPTPLTARVGFHWGPVVLRTNRPEDVAAGATPFEVDGVALPTAARIMSVANGGQTLFSSQAADVMKPAMPLDMRIHLHGHWRLKGINEPLELYEVGHASGAVLPPEGSSKAYRVLLRDGIWIPTESLPNNLGSEPDVFVGRTTELQALAAAFNSGIQSVTLLGIGGVGKTRLAQRYARSWLGDYPGGVWFCDLAQAREPDGIAFAVAQALTIQLGGDDPVERLSAQLVMRGTCLLVLDNFEQVARFAGKTLSRWIRAAPKVRFLVTSREVLGLPGEHIEGLPPLTNEEAVQLFKGRRISAGIAEPLSVADLDALPKLVELLDRLPLAVELAASRARTVAPADLVTRIGERFRLLATRSGRTDRQATLRATLDWSWELLSELERASLAQLSVFEGGFTLKSAESVLDISSLSDDFWVGDALQSLVEKSLVRRLTAERFDLLRTVKDYAAERLKGGDISADRRHWMHFAGLSEVDATRGGCIELDNIVIACRRATAASVSGEDASATRFAVETLVNVWALLRLSGPFRLITALAAPLVERTDLSASQRARVQRVLGGAAGLMGHPDVANEHYENALQLARVAAEPELEAQVQCLLGDLHVLHGRHEAARAALDAAAKMVQGQALSTLMLHNALGNLELSRSNVVASIKHYKLALRAAQTLGERRWEGGLHGSLGSAAVVQGQFDVGQGHLKSAVQIATELGDRQWEGNARCNLGLLLFELNESDAAHHELSLSLAISRELGHRRLEATVLCNLGLVTRAKGRLNIARELLEMSVALAQDLKAPRSEGIFRGYLGELLSELGEPDAAQSCHRAAERLLGEPGDTAGLALLYCQETASAIHRNDLVAAATFVESAAALRLSLGSAADAELLRALDRVQSLVSQHCSR